jgi:nicotinamidase-related amidase
MLEIKDTVFVLVDVQGSLAEAMHDKENLFRTLDRLIQGVQALGLPIVWLEQTPEKIGRTLSDIRRLMGAENPIRKECFSCAMNDEFMRALGKTGRKTVLMAGIEAHVCVYQTACDLIARGYRVEVVADAVSSRSPRNLQIGLDRIRAVGGQITTLETALFELMRTSTHPAFRDILKLVR